MGFNKIAKYYYTPGWHEPCAKLEFFFNKELYDSLPADIQAAIDAVSMRVHAWVLAEFDAQNGTYLDQLVSSGVQLRRFPKPVLDELRKQTKVAIEELTAADPLSKKVYESYQRFQQKMDKYTALTEKSYYDDIQVVENGYL